MDISEIVSSQGDTPEPSRATLSYAATEDDMLEVCIISLNYSLIGRQSMAYPGLEDMLDMLICG